MITVSVPLNDTHERLELSHSKLLSDLVGDNYNSKMMDNDNDTSSIISDLTNDHEEARSTTINAHNHSMNNVMDDAKSCAKSHASSCDSLASSFADLLNMMHTLNKGKESKDSNSNSNMFDTPISVKSRVSFAKSDTCIGQPPSTRRRGLLQRRNVYTSKNSSDSRGQKSFSAATTTTRGIKSRKSSSADSVGQRITVPTKKGSTSLYTPSNTSMPKTPRPDTRRSKKHYTSRRSAEMSRYKLIQEEKQRKSREDPPLDSNSSPLIAPPTPALLSSSYLISTKKYDGCSETPPNKSSCSSSQHSSSGMMHSSSPKSGKKQQQQQQHCSEQKLIAIVDQALETELNVDAYVHVSDLIWVEKMPPYREGRYSGVIDKKKRPHGRGTWICSSSATKGETLFGWWCKGFFIPNEFISQKVNEKKNEMNKHPDKSSASTPFYSKSNSHDAALLRKSSRKMSESFHDESLLSSSHRRSRSAEPLHSFDMEQYTRQTKQEKENNDDNTSGPGPLHQGMRANYKLGETLRSNSDILSKRESMEAIIELQENDVAFVKRTNGKYTYARVVGICTTNKYGKENEEEALEFKVNAEGSTKTFPKWMWSKFIRCCAVVEKSPREVNDDIYDSDNINVINNRNNDSSDNVQKQTRQNQQQQQQQQCLDNEISPTSVKTDVGPQLLSKVRQQQQQQQRQRREKICSRLDSMNSADTGASSLEGQVYWA